jgi:hypothetical protein
MEKQMSGGHSRDERKYIAVGFMAPPVHRLFSEQAGKENFQ